MRLQPLAVCRPPSLSSTSRLPSRIEPARSPCRKYDQADSLPQRPFLGRSCQAVTTVGLRSDYPVQRGLLHRIRSTYAVIIRRARRGGKSYPLSRPAETRTAICQEEQVQTVPKCRLSASHFKEGGRRRWGISRTVLLGISSDHSYCVKLTCTQ